MSASADDQYEQQNDVVGGDVPAGDAKDNDYASRTGQSQIPVQKDDAPVADPIDPATADSDRSLGMRSTLSKRSLHGLILFQSKMRRMQSIRATPLAAAAAVRSRVVDTQSRVTRKAFLDQMMGPVESHNRLPRWDFLAVEAMPASGFIYQACTLHM